MPDTDGWTKVADLDDMMEGEGYDTGEEVGGHIVGIFQVDGELYACGQCTHEEGPVCQGRPDNFVVQCPWHSAQFDIRDGSCVVGPVACRTDGNVEVGEELEHEKLPPLQCYDIRVEGKEIFVRPRV